MKPYYEQDGITIYHGDCREIVPQLDIKFSAVCTDPPYGLSKEPDIAEVLTHWLAGDDYRGTSGGFMNKAWDSFVPGPATWKAVAEKMLPGAHLASFAGTRTYDLMGISIRLAGLHYRETALWLHGQGFPKGRDVSKSIDKMLGAERDVVGRRTRPDGTDRNYESWNAKEGTAAYGDYGVHDAITAPATPEAEKWRGWNVALKPAMEPIILARKPLSGTVAANVLAHGTGALNIDACRVGYQSEADKRSLEAAKSLNGKHKYTADAAMCDGGRDHSATVTNVTVNDTGRWPPNVLMDDTAAAMLDQMSGERKAGVAVKRNGVTGTDGTRTYGKGVGEFPVGTPDAGYGDTGGASRFMNVIVPDPEDNPVLPIDDPDTLRFRYEAKASRRERNAGLDGLPEHERDTASGNNRTRVCGTCGLTDNGSNDHSQCGDAIENRTAKPATNSHPTVKPLAVMTWLLTLVTPPGGTVLDPFAGSGTTGVAAAQLGIPCVLIEQEAEYLPIIAGRIDHALNERTGAELPLFAGLEAQP